MVDGGEYGDDRGALLQASARGWLTLQLAALGFVGLCGALKAGGSGTAAPRSVEAIAGVLVLLALFVACLAVYLVGRTAWPHATAADDPSRAARRLRTGLALTFVTVLLTAVAATTSWWPEPASASQAPGTAGTATVEVTTATGTWCGELARGTSALTLSVQGRTVEVPLSEVVAVTPVAACTRS
ncbi:hypothetical protein ACIGEZ_33680 [Streptomyces sp. NPDC085481]|uniref:hypothetical protein n=1 Tax=Streptomyces sp. NPDC085481 TaxID=3365727 RepID=UPI0037D98F2F